MDSDAGPGSVGPGVTVVSLALALCFVPTGVPLCCPVQRLAAVSVAPPGSLVPCLSWSVALRLESLRACVIGTGRICYRDSIFSL